MAAPQLDTCCFPKLYSNKDSSGTVTGTGIHHNDAVTIRSKSSSKIWVGNVTTLVAGNTWNAVVHKKPDGERATETVGVTVTNSGNEESNEVTQNSDVP